LWNSRAWTFQERLLSRRLLIFQSGHMIWHCRQTIAHEDMPASDKGIPYPLLPWLTLRKQLLGSEGKIDGSIMILPDGTTSVVRSETFRQYAHLVSQYTHRSLTNDGDILNALGGLLHIFRQFFKFPMRYGLPEILFDVALLWQPTEVLEPRLPDSEEDEEGERFPSWSWAGWKGRVQYEEPFEARADELLGTLTRVPLPPHEYRRFERIRPLVRWYVPSKTTGSLSLLNKSGLGIPLFGKSAELPGEWDKDPFGEGEKPGPLRVEELPREMMKRLQWHHLVFRTVVLGSKEVMMGKPTLQESDCVYDPEYPPQRYSLTSSASPKSIGTLLLDGDEPDQLSENHEFVVISEAQYYGTDYEPSGEDGFPLYNVLLVEWNEERTAARRLGLGRVDKKAWWKAGPKAKIVCLE